MMGWHCHTHMYMKECAHTLAVKAETVPVTADVRHQIKVGTLKQFLTI